MSVDLSSPVEIRSARPGRSRRSKEPWFAIPTAAPVTLVLVDTPLVDLSEQGDAQFNGRVGALPVVCSTEPDVAFLIRVGAGKWIANATVLR